MGQLENAVQDFTIQVRPAFFGQYENRKKKLLTKLQAGGVFQTVPSDRGLEEYPRHRATPQLVEYDEGNISVGSFGHDKFSVPNRLFGKAIELGRIHFEDMGHNPAAKAALMERVTGLATRAVNFQHKMMADFLLGSGLFAGTETGIDAVTFFSDSHEEGSNLVDSGDGASSASTQAQFRVEHNLVMGKWADQQDPDGHDLLREEGPDQLTVLCDPQLLSAYGEFFRAQTVPRFDTDSSSYSGGAGVSNVMSPLANDVMRGIDGLGRDVLLVGWNRLKGQSMTLYVDRSGELPGPPPLMHQERVAPDLEDTGVGPSSLQWVKDESVIFKTRLRGNIFIGDYNKIVKIDKS